MKFFFYPRLAWSGIRKNGKLYLPYFLTCCGMVMMFYIMVFLAEGEALAQVKGGNIMQEILGLGVQVLGIFSGIFLFYTNSFLIRRRQKEFGLYNILGMGKGNLARLVLWETLILAVLSLLCGLGAGVLFSKIAELFMINLLFGDVTFTLRISFSSLFLTVKVFAGIFLLIALRSLWKIRVSRPVELLGSESVGEKPPRANYLYGLAGALMLICAYYLAAVSQNPLEAIPVFFAAVVLVILATYLPVVYVGFSGAVQIFTETEELLLQDRSFCVRIFHGLQNEAQRRRPGFHLYPLYHGAGDAVRHHEPLHRRRGYSAQSVPQESCVPGPGSEAL